MSITRVAQDIKHGDGSNFDHSVTFASLTIPAGALIVVKFSSPQSPNMNQPAGVAGDTFLHGPNVSTSSNNQDIWYVLSSAGGTAAITAGLSNGSSEYGASVEVYTGGTWTYDSANSGTKAGSFGTSALTTNALSTSGAGLLATVFGQYNYPVSGNAATQSPGSVVNSGTDGTTVVMASGEVINTSAFSGTITCNIQKSPAAATKLDITYASFLSSGGGGGALAGAANLAISATGTIAGKGALVGAANLAVSAAATLAGKAAAAGSAGLTLAASGVLKGAGALAGAANAAIAATGTLAAKGALSGSAALTFATTAALTGAGALSGTAPLAISATATPSGRGALAGTSDLILSATGTPTAGGGNLAGSASLSIGATGALKGTGKLAGAAALTVAQSGTLTGSGKLSGAANTVFTAVARPNGSSALAGSANLAFAATGTLRGRAPIAGSANLAFASTGALRATGLLAGQGNVAFTAQGTPSGHAALGGTAALTFYVTGTLTNGLPSLPADPLYYVQMPPRSFYAALAGRSFYAAMPPRSFYVLSDPDMTASMSNLDPRETEVLTLDASNDLANGETLTNIKSVAITVQSGPPTSTLPTLTGQIINGSPVTLTVNGKTITIATGCCVQVVGSGGVSGTQYLIAITCSTSNPDKVLTLKGILPVSAQ